MPTEKDFLVLLVVVLQLMILYFLIEINRALRHRVTADNNEQRAVRRPEFIINVQGQEDVQTKKGQRKPLRSTKRKSSHRK